MDKEMLEALSKLLDEKLKPIHSDIKEMKIDIKNLKSGQEKLINKFDDLEAKNATRHIEINLKLDELKELKQVTKENCYDIAKLKAVK